jgi:hypothetical protein
LPGWSVFWSIRQEPCCMWDEFFILRSGFETSPTLLA